MSLSQWTHEDWAVLTQIADEMSSGQQYCQYCQVVPVQTSIDLCDSCIEEMCSYLVESQEAYYQRMAEEAKWQQQFSLEV